MTDQTRPDHPIIIGVGCDSGQYYFEVLPADKGNALTYTGIANVTPARAANVWNAQYNLNNIKRSTRYDDRNWKADFNRPVSDMPNQATIDAMEELNERATDAQYGVL